MRLSLTSPALLSVLLPVLYGCLAASRVSNDGLLRVATFQANVTPPLGSPLCNGNNPPAVRIVDPLTARGIVLLADGGPIVLCAVDWVGIGNEAHREWRTSLARAAGTSPERVCVHTVHQHDAPGCDFVVEDLLKPRGLGGRMCDVRFSRTAIARTADAIHEALATPRVVTHVGLGQATVERIASNRRVLGPDGKVQHIRFSTCRDKAVAAAPEGTIDPQLRLVSLWENDQPIASLMYYACHTQSFYGDGAVNTDFVGLARGLREATLPTVQHVYFAGAGGNIAAGKYNDGSPLNRFALAGRLADAMSRAWKATMKQPVARDNVEYRVLPMGLPLREGWSEERCLTVLDDISAELRARIRAARDLTWVRRCQRNETTDLTSLRIGNAWILHMPGELFVEYQLAAQRMRPNDLVCVAAYGDYGPGYIGTAIAYDQGGYETGPVSRVSPKVEPVLMDAMRELLK